MLASRFALAFALLAAPLALPGVALARDASDEVVATASRTAAKPPTEAEIAKAQADAKVQAEAARAAKPVSTQDQVAAWLADSPPIERVDNGPNGYAMRPNVDVNGYPLGPDGKRQIHGETGVSIGTGGYRSGYVSTLIPIGEASTLGIAVGQTDYGKHGRGYGYGYGGGYGYDGLGGYDGGYGWGPRGGTSQSLALSLDMRGGGRSKSDTPEGCAPGFRDGDRYVEPPWVTQMRGDARTCTAADRP
ncbi:hypothetical protein ASD79_02235 [Caulobacter sp. Root655]|uniref:hypothetical protein n=1 Tax=Caulobacter sp. Root655 TaxID=1736578 RepID=UPI0006F8F381|nr:hypothetical protein [Caulobacter sp. Root655]KRA66123.1 hypothetical protein ASD79_02235 [Caulobacter sp. Root655]